MSVLAAVSVPATTANLGPGYDALGAALDLRLVVAAVERGDGPLVTTVGEGADEVADDEDNLVWRSLLTACDRFGWPVPDVALRVRNPIPLARGMGSSSAAIVGGLALARLLAGADASVGAEQDPVGDTALTTLATELEGHPDNVAPAVHGGLVAAATTDDGRTVLRTLPPPATSAPLLLVPPTRQLTSEAREVVPEQLTREAAIQQAARAAHVLGGLAGLFPVDPGLSGDLLHEPPRAEVMPAAGRLLRELRGAGLHAWLSGAGPAVAVAVAPADERARATAGGLAADAGFEPLLLAWDRQGVRSCVPDGCGIAGTTGCSDCPRTAVQ